MPKTYGDDIQSPRPLFKVDLDEEDLKKGVQRIVLGSKCNGVYIDVSKTGITFNGYYEGFSERGAKYACVRNPVEIPWDDLDRMRSEAKSTRRKRRARKKLPKPDNAPYFVDEKPDKKYLNSLPIVTLNGKGYYIDVDRRERRDVDKPSHVYRY